MVSHGVDSLYLSGRGNPRKEDLERLLKARDELRSTKGEDSLPVSLGGTEFLLSDAGGPTSVFLSNGDLRVALGAANESTRPNLSFVLSSRLLWTRGVQAAVADVLKFAQAVIEDPDQHSLWVSRLDLAADVQALESPDTEDPRWVTRANKRARHTDHHQLTGLVFGRGKRMVRVYDKTKEIQHSGKQFMHGIWEAGGWTPGQAVWRIEAQCRREALLESGMQEARTVEDVTGSLDAVWQYMVGEWLTLRHGQRTSRWDRARLHPIWEELLRLSFAEPREVEIQASATPSTEVHLLAVRGHLSSYGALLDLDSQAEALEALDRDLKRLEQRQPGVFRDKLAKRKARLAKLGFGVGLDQA